MPIKTSGCVYGMTFVVRRANMVRGTTNKNGGEKVMLFLNRRKRGKRGFTLMELVVSTAIIGTLAAFAVPSYIQANNKAKGAKSLDNVNIIGSAILNAYSRVANQGGRSGNAIATLNTSSPFDGSGLPSTTDSIIFTADGGLTLGDIFPNGLPASPFGQGYMITVNQAGNGSYTMSSDGILTLTVSQKPQFEVKDVARNVIKRTFTP